MTALITLTAGGLEIARRLKPLLPDAAIHAPSCRVTGADVAFDKLADHLRTLFQAGEPIIGLCAAGALIRILAPLLADKRTEPAVLAVAEDGSAVVPLLGGHHGANDLARQVAQALGIAPAITTAGDLRFGVALDDPPAGWRLSEASDYKGFMADLLGGQTVRIDGDLPWLAEAELPLDPAAHKAIVASTRALPADPDRLVFHPATLAIGVGCERGAEAAEIEALIRDTLAEAGLALEAVAALVTVDLKADEAGLQAAAQALGLPLRVFDPATLEAETPRLANPSEVVFREIGCHGVAEAAALAAAGPGGRLIVEKHKSRRATCAVAETPDILDPDRIGRRRGTLALIGMGPGRADWRAPEADRLIARATDLVGYSLYIDLLGPAAAGKTRHDYKLGEEELRVRAALDLAAEGRDVALICSGDAGIYAMGSLLWELVERGGRPDWRRVEITTVPGISAMQAAAARIGAPLGHDFCTISLSDLMTPWPAIEKRIAAAGQGDFVVAFYNPVSQRRRSQLARAREILLAHRPAATPVVLGRNLGREGETLTVTTLGELTVDMVDMLTLVLVGSSESRALVLGDGTPRVYTPRGYGDKPEAQRA
ncbi:cobalt-precorrin 5A hydrolase/precorrin-3B C17-methyltransferase [Inquilinus ginsengisoli]|uniref:Cobalt-precorrin 5A hydrolase/precorrin-3B C17-methyltransferase n=1 Tax=Inquilinus ginsengisoli TaxID=363840 RepID=A0ABU1JRZ8_9PROT|nr:precorrin-3B C(17)-methyltransferase [Inquilinus ginsengisoli]MDR6291388.1 cobalt-precorrin 5A hydrolase/precorrin-3B C17-methyltransferase [Inquilinus ginsengisoli]